ncbi:MAG: biotin--[acetyl-CoA-carboxylase] ligase [Candidatus Rokubacteria bacterium]|nr:biotin--[acetyl-CoA-carboxylase] ligase [Candidatus Rokubacteria bacterium]
MAETLARSSLFPRLAARLPIGRVGKVFYAFETTGSTQDEIRRLAEAGAPEGTLVVADHQTRGRGRQGRAWLDEPGSSLLLSLLLRPEIPAGTAPQLSLLAAVASADALTGATALPVGIRWPNDLEVRARKVGGILAEASATGEQVSHVVVGIGINVNQTRFPAALARPATSLALEVGRPLDREPLLEALVASLDRWYTRYVREGFAPVREGWCQASVTLGQPVDGGGVTGTAEDLDVDGALLVRTAAGARTRLVAGAFR